MALRLDPISLTALILLAYMVGLLTYEHIETGREKSGVKIERCLNQQSVNESMRGDIDKQKIIKATEKDTECL